MQHTFTRNGDGYDFVVRPRQMSAAFILLFTILVFTIPAVIIRMIARMQPHKFTVKPGAIVRGGKTVEFVEDGDLLLRNMEMASLEMTAGSYTSKRMIAGDAVDMMNYNFVESTRDVMRGTGNFLIKEQYKVSFRLFARNAKGKKVLLAGGLKVGDAEALARDVQRASAGAL